MQTLTQKIEDLKNQIAELEKLNKSIWSKKTGCENVITFSLFDKYNVVYKCDNLAKVSNVLKSFEPYKTSFEISDTPKKYISSPYRIDIKNDYHNRNLKIQFELINNTVITIEIDFNNLQKTELLEDFFILTNRHLYDTETHYVNLPSHYKEFKNIRIPSYRFTQGEEMNWYGGNKTLVDVKVIDSIINLILEIE